MDLRIRESFNATKNLSLPRTGISLVVTLSQHVLSENECTIDLSAQILKIISILDLSDSIQLVLGSFPAIFRLSISYLLEIKFYLL